MTVIGFVGYPNVGKSSVINIFMENKRLQVSATPGKVCNLLYFEQIIDVKNYIEGHDLLQNIVP